MLDAKRRPWFRSCAVLTCFLTLWWATEAWAIGDNVRNQRAREAKLNDVARLLGVDPQAVGRSDSWKRREAEVTAARRAAALERLRTRTASPNAQVRNAVAVRQ